MAKFLSSPLQPPPPPPLESPDTRIEDYLDDKLQSAADLDALSALLAGVESQRSQLQAQLDTAARELEAARSAAQDKRRELLARAADFQALQRSIDERAEASAAADAPAEAMARLEPSLKRLHAVTLAERYLVVVKEVQALEAEARSHLPGHAHKAIVAHGRLRDIAETLRARNNDGEVRGAIENLVVWVRGVVDGLWADMKSAMRQELKVLLDARGWHLKQVEPTSEMDAEWMSAVERALDMQLWEVVDWTAATTTATATATVTATRSPPTLLAIDAMAAVLVDEFRYHFMNDAKADETSSPRRLGSHCLPWVLDTAERWGGFFRDNLCPLLADKLRGTPAAARPAHADPAAALVASLLPVVADKVEQVRTEVVRTPALLSSFVTEVLAFDDAVRSRLGYDTGWDADEKRQGWPGLATEVLLTREDAEDGDAEGGNSDNNSRSSSRMAMSSSTSSSPSPSLTWSRWFAAEKDFALKRYSAIVSAADAREIDFDYYYNSAAGGPSSRTKPTFGAVRVTDLLRAVTGVYTPVWRFRYRIRFLIGVQLEILDRYHDRLRSALEAYGSMTSAVGRTLHGASKEEIAALEGTGALESLCRVYGSAEHIVNTLKEWSNEEFFVSLWHDLQSRANNRRSDSSLPAQTSMSYDEVRDRTSAAVGADGGDADTGALFDETVVAYSARRAAAGEFLASALGESFVRAFRAYSTRAQWTMVVDGVAVDPTLLGVTPELDEPLGVIKRSLVFLTRALSSAALRRALRPALEGLQELLWSDVLMHRRFTALGAAQFRRDVDAVIALVERYVPGSGLGGLAPLDEALRLLTLPVGGETEDVEADATLTIGEASDRVFTDNAEAKRVLDEMGIESLVPANARNILQRRVENNE